MDFVEITEILEDYLIRGCILYKSTNYMQKTVNYINTSTFSININNHSYANIKQALFLTENNIVYLYLISNNEGEIKFSTNQIDSLEVVT